MKKLIYYRKELNSLNIWTKIEIVLDNNYYKLAMEIYYSKTNTKI